MTTIKVLATLEREVFENPPELGSEERKKYFRVPKWAEKCIEKFRSPTNKVGFVLMLGYFRAVKRIFIPKKYHEYDCRYVANQLGISTDQVDLDMYNRKTQSRHKEIMLKNMGYKSFNNNIYKEFMDETDYLVAKQLKPRTVFRELLDYLIRNKIEVPTYNFFAKAISISINQYEKKLLQIVGDNITRDQKILLDELIGIFEEEKAQEEQNNQRNQNILTRLKRINQSLRPGKINKSVDNFDMLRQLFHMLENLINALDLSNEVIKYYAESVIRHDTNKLRIKAESKRYLQMTCFIIHQYYKHNDALIDIMLKSVQNNHNTCMKEYKERSFDERQARDTRTKELITAYQDDRWKLRRIKTIIAACDTTDTEKIVSIKSLIEDENEQQNREDILQQLTQEIDSTLKNEMLYEIYQSRFRKLQNRVGRIVKCIDFDISTSSSKIMEAVNFYKSNVISSNAPMDFLDEEKRELLYNQSGQVKPNLYKALLYTEIAAGIKSGAVNLKYSYKYKAFNDYLIQKEVWMRHREELIKRAGLTDFLDIDRVLHQLKRLLDRAYHKTNRNILNKSNEHVKIDCNGKIIVHTPKVSREITDPLSDLFPGNRYISLTEVLATVNKYCGFLEAFQHPAIKYNRPRPHDSSFFGCTIGYGCNIGIAKLAKISSFLNLYEFENTANWYFIPENILAANNKILDLMKRMPLPEYLKSLIGLIHTASDGQKYNVHGDSLNAHPSFKYLGLGKGVSAYSFIDSRHFLFHSLVISAAEREAAYVIDGLMHNDIVKSDIHSTDTHGYTETIFATTHLLGFSFAPRIKNFMKQTLYSFKKIKEYKDAGYHILPKRYINTAIIKEHWDDILRFIATIKLKEATASQLFKRLSSYSKNHPLYTAIKAFGQIIKSIFLLKYIDDVNLRQAIMKQLNIGENSNKFSKAVFHGNNQEFIYATKEEQEVAEGCKRLIKNAIICWNYLYISQLIVNEEDEEKRKEIIRTVKNGSIECWAHINFHGEFNFSSENLKDFVGFLFPKIMAYSFA